MFIWSHTHSHTVLPLVTAGSFGVIHTHTQSFHWLQQVHLVSYTCTYSPATGYSRFIWSHTHSHTVLPLVTAGSFGVIHTHTVLSLVTAGSFRVIHIHTVLPLVTAGLSGVIHIYTVLPLVTAGSFGVVHIHTVLPMVTAGPFGVIHIHAVLPLVTACLLYTSDAADES